MNKYEQQADLQRRAGTRSAMNMGTAAVALLVVAFLIYGLNSSAPPRFFSGVAIAAAILLLLLRQLSRRSRAGKPRSAQPDPRSKLNL